MIPRLEKCMCGCSLYTGALILAWLYVISSTMLLLILVTAGYPAVDYIQEQLMTKSDLEDADYRAFVVRVIFGVMLAMVLFAFTTNSLLLAGVYKRNHCLMVPQLIISAIGLCLNVMTCFFTFFMAFQIPQLFANFFVQSFITVVAVYFWLILYSYFREVKDQNLMNQVSSFNKI